ncbi:hypothetical protein AB0D08_15390 [Kitasatospora sp. NPDC048540]|uniref:3-dehydroquinate synthase family protein n=1 Tax=Kitasatospora sp. NPDC048540 TaxID=3155634 RepID=UPI0033DB9305
MTHPTRPAALDRQIQTGGATVRLLARSGPATRPDLTTELAALHADLFVAVTGPGSAEAFAADLPARAVRMDVPAAGTLRSVERLAERALAAGATRRSVVLGVGGGRAAHTAGLLAGLLFNGLRLVQVPGTLAAACGPALSLRHTVGSGVLGLWQAPELVFCPLDRLAAASAGPADLVEAVRAVLAVSPAGYRPLAAALRPEGGYRPRELAAFLALCADARAAVTRDDPLERGPGRALGYGRTVGRAIRLLAGGALGEGPSEGLGMLVAARIAVRLGLLPAEDEQAHRDLLRRAGLPVVLPPGVDPAGLAAAVPVAAARDGEDGLVLLTGLGRPHTGRGSLLTGVDDRALRAGAEAVRPTGVPHSRTSGVPAPAER